MWLSSFYTRFVIVSLIFFKLIVFLSINFFSRSFSSSSSFLHSFLSFSSCCPYVSFSSLHYSVYFYFHFFVELFVLYHHFLHNINLPFYPGTLTHAWPRRGEGDPGIETSWIQLKSVVPEVLGPQWFFARMAYATFGKNSPRSHFSVNNTRTLSSEDIKKLTCNLCPAYHTF